MARAAASCTTDLPIWRQCELKARVLAGILGADAHLAQGDLAVRLSDNGPLIGFLARPPLRPVGHMWVVWRGLILDATAFTWPTMARDVHGLSEMPSCAWPRLVVLPPSGNATPADLERVAFGTSATVTYRRHEASQSR